MLTASRLRHVLSYDAESGIFRWKNPTGPRAQRGAVAGSRTQGYVNISVDGQLYRAHRLAWLYVHGDFPASNIDHVNGRADDNRICNLREANQSQNTANARRRSDCKSGFKGVTAYRGRWVASVRHNGVRVHLGVFGTPESAHAAYVAAAHSTHGEFARAA